MDAVKRFAALLVLIMTAATAAPVTCAGWEGTPASRRACCNRAHHASCPDQASADNCCAGHEHGRVATMTPATAVAYGQAVPILVPSFDVAILDTSVAYAMALTKQLHRSPHLPALSLRV
jgi:hypothetical protein